MRLLKKINNNFALALDSKGDKIIVEGKGIGFQKMPTELTDLSLITRTYYNTKEQDITLIKSVSEEVLSISEEVCMYAQNRIADKLNPNLRFILADHIDFAIEREKKNIQMKMPIHYDITLLYPEETNIAKYAMKLIKEKLNISLPDSELSGIALNIINSEINYEQICEDKDDLIELIGKFIESSMSIQINRYSFSYSRFVSHMEYLLRRADKKSLELEKNANLYKSMIKEIPEISYCVNGISELLKKREIYLNDDEKLYLMLHVNRLCSREGL